MTLIDPAISWTLALSVAVLFGAAASHKLRDWKQFRDVVLNYKLLPDAVVPLAAIALIALECAAAIFVLIVATRSIGAILSAGILATYAVAMAVNLRRGRVNLDCGCLGIGRRQPVRWWMVGRNLAMAVLALIAGLPMASRELTALDGVTIIGATLSLAFLYTAQSLLGAAPRSVLE